MTVPELRMLEALAQWGPLTARDLKDDLGGTAQSHSARLRSLRRRGFVVQTDPAAHIWDITDKGLELLGA